MACKQITATLQTAYYGQYILIIFVGYNISLITIMSFPRGTTFRGDYRNIKKLRSILPCPVALLTGTATQDMVFDICKSLEVEAEVVSVVPNR